MSIIKRHLSKHNIILHKGKNLHILTTLTWNTILSLKLRLYKVLHNVHAPIVHYYAVCWNEEKMLPFVFSYYGKFVDRFFIYDNGSTDRTEEIIAAQPNAELIPFETEGFDDIVHADIKNNCWKHSRGKADYVVVCDIDEFAYNPDMKVFLNNLNKNCVSLPTPYGYSMFSKIFPEIGKGEITEQVRTGVPDEGYSKCILFDPHRIIEINYDPGAHICHPLGVVNRNADYKVLHYKNLDIEAVLRRTRINAARLSPTNREHNLGFGYLYPEERIRKEFEEGLAKSQDVIS